MKDALSLALQYLLPQHFVSRVVGKLANIKNNTIKNFFIRCFIRHFKINLNDAEFSNLNDYDTFNAFFTRKLKKGTRPYPKAKKVISSPVDGTISQIGNITKGQLIQAKGRYFSLLELLGGETNHATHFKNGKFATLYLSPSDYHRVHMPIKGKLVGMTHVPGKLFSVNNHTANNVPNLYARNERAVMFFESENGPFILVMVGAMLVASIVTSFLGKLTPPTLSSIKHYNFENAPKEFQRGQELGFFEFGSTVILVFEADQLNWRKSMRPGSDIKLGQSLEDSV